MNNQKKYLILKNAFGSNSKLYIYIFFLIILCGVFAVIAKSFGLIKIVSIVIFIVILFLALSIWFLKIGLVKNKYGISIGYFAWGKLLFTESIGILNNPFVTILKFKKRERAAYHIANPEFSQSFNSFDIYLLNKKHTVKKEIISLNNEQKAESAISFLIENTKLKYEIYSPDFS